MTAPTFTGADEAEAGGGGSSGSRLSGLRCTVCVVVDGVMARGAAYTRCTTSVRICDGCVCVCVCVCVCIEKIRVKDRKKRKRKGKKLHTQKYKVNTGKEVRLSIKVYRDVMNHRVPMH